MNHGTCEETFARPPIWIRHLQCSSPVKFRCENPLNAKKIMTCGIHKRRYAKLGWNITNLAREAGIKEESNA